MIIPEEPNDSSLSDDNNHIPSEDSVPYPKRLVESTSVQTAPTIKYFNISEDTLDYTLETVPYCSSSRSQSSSSTAYFCISDKPDDNDYTTTDDTVPVVDLQQQLVVDGIDVISEFQKALASRERLLNLWINNMKNKKLQSAYHAARTNVDSLWSVAQEHGIELDDCPERPQNICFPKKHRKGRLS